MTERLDSEHNAVRWQKARIVSIRTSTPRIKSFMLAPEHTFRFYPGQHVDVKLTADDGYVAMRSYSIASSPLEQAFIELAIERLDDGEVSPFFHDTAAVGDEVEMRGPLGGHFILRPEDREPVLLIGGGSGVVPLVSMVRSQKALRIPISLLVSARTWDDILFRDELIGLQTASSSVQVTFALTRDKPRRPGDYGKRIDALMLKELLRKSPSQPLRAYICG